MNLKKTLTVALLGTFLCLPSGALAEANAHEAASAVASAVRGSGKTMSADHYYNKGCDLQKKHMYAQAIAAYTKAIEMDGNYAEAYNNRGIIYNSQKKYQLAVADYTAAISVRPDYEIAYYNRGNTYLDMKMYSAAAEDYTAAINLKPDYTNAYYNRSIAFDNLGDSAGSEADMNMYYSLGGE